MNWLKTIFGSLFSGGGGGLIGKGLDIVAERTEDADKRNAMILELVKIEAEAARNPAWLKALESWDKLTFSARAGVGFLIAASGAHLLGRLVLWGVVAWMGVEALRTGALTIEEFAAIAAGPALYTIAKGRGK